MQPHARSIEEASKPFTTLDWALHSLRPELDEGKRRTLPLPLMIPLVMIMGPYSVRACAERRFPKQDQPRRDTPL